MLYFNLLPLMSWCLISLCVFTLMTLNLIQTLHSQWSSGNQRIAEYKFQVIMAFKHCIGFFSIKQKGSWILVGVPHVDVSNFLEKCIFHINFCLLSILYVVLELQTYKKEFCFLQLALAELYEDEAKRQSLCSDKRTATKTSNPKVSQR